jgi:RAQPRD family integrative conjugative element protein
MRNLKKSLIILSAFIVFSICLSAWSDPSAPLKNSQASDSFQSSSSEQERIYLIQLLNQINAMLPTIQAAKKQQLPNTRIKFHYTQYRDANGQIHNGILEDVQAIKRGIEEKLNGTSIEPRSVQPIHGDYLNG